MTENTRPTAKIDRAWRRKDAEGVANALAEYASDEEQVVCFTIENSRSRTITLYLEPWAEAIEMSAGAKIRVLQCERKRLDEEHGIDQRALISVTDDAVTVWASSGAIAYIVDDVRA